MKAYLLGLPYRTIAFMLILPPLGYAGSAETQRISTLAGTGSHGDGPEGDPLQCGMAGPRGIFVDESAAIYIGDTLAHRVRVISGRADAP